MSLEAYDEGHGGRKQELHCSIPCPVYEFLFLTTCRNPFLHPKAGLMTNAGLLFIAGFPFSLSVRGNNHEIPHKLDIPAAESPGLAQHMLTDRRGHRNLLLGAENCAL